MNAETIGKFATRSGICFSRFFETPVELWLPSVTNSGILLLSGQTIGAKLTTIHSSTLVCVFFLMIFTFCPMLAESATPHSLSPVEQFKEFISSPKAAVTIEATIRTPETIRVNVTNSFERQATAHVRCFWTSNLLAYSEDFELPGMLKRRVDVIQDGDSFTTRTVVGGTNESSLSGGTVKWTGTLHPPLDLENPVVVAYKRARDHFRTIMNFGIPEIEVGAARWVGQRVSADGYAVSQPVTFSGTLEVNETGDPSSLKLKRTSLGGILNYEIQYGPPRLKVQGSDSTSLPARLEVLSFTNPKNTTKPIQDVGIEKIALVSPDQVRREVGRLTLLAGQMTNQFVVQGSILYARAADGRLIPDRRLPQASLFHLSLSAGKRLYWGMTITFAAGFLLFLGRGVQKTKHMNSEKTENL